MTHLPNKYRWIGIALVAVTVGIGAWWSLYDTSEKSVMDKWKTANTRKEAARELIESHRLVGMTENEVIGLLGQPDAPYDASSRWTYRWFLGYRKSGSSMMFDYDEYLVIQIREGTVTEATIINADGAHPNHRP